MAERPAGAAGAAGRPGRAWEVVADAAAAIAAASSMEGALRALLAGMAALTGAEAGGVRVLDERDSGAPVHRLYFWQGGDRYDWRQLAALPGTNTARVLESGRGLYSADLAAAAAAGDATALPALRDGIRSSLIVPLRAAGRVIGTLHADARRPHAFAEAQLPPLQVLADHAGGAVEQARLRAAAEARLRQLEVAARVSAAVNAAGDLDELLTRVLAEAAALVGAHRGTIALVDADRRYVRGRVGLGLPPGVLEATVRRLYAAPHPEEDIFALIARTDEQAVVEDDHPALHRPTTERFGLRGEHRVFTPIRHGGEVIGVLTVSWVGEAVPRQDDLAMLRLIAEQAGGAIARARLAEAERAHLRLLEQERAKLAESEARFRGAFQESAVGTALAGLDGRLLQVNAAFCRMLGYGEAELLAATFPGLIHPDDRPAARDTLRGLLGGELATHHAERRYLHRSGELLWVLVGVSLVRDAAGRPAYFVAQFQDITARKRAEEERAALLAAEAALRDRDAFLSVAAHELKTPITSLRGFAQLLERRLPPGAESAPLRAMVARIDRQSAKLIQLVNRLLDFSRLEGGRLALSLEEVDLARLVRDVTAAMQAQAPERRVDVSAPATLPIRADPLRLEQVLTNLLDNALKYSPPDAPVAVRLERSGLLARLAVRDQGPGIPPEQRGRIFEQFYRVDADRRVGGMGLGLYLSRQIAELHGGQVTAEFPPEGGSVFLLTLPLGPLPPD